jgi:Protein of unknown function (DUF1592)/Protein of unknown function (DUF1588)/Protein of unknown function (DUF1587)/Protein of unknown function (DUF1585)/Protein of unknown function (DUF1595)
MSRVVVLAGLGLAVLAAAAGTYLWLQRSPAAILEDRWAMLDTYCTDCHNDAELAAGISFEHVRPDEVVNNAKIWEAAIRKLRLGVMPPRDERQPETGVREEFAAALERTLDAAAVAHPYAGAQPVHRLNRAEYANVIRDLFGIEMNVMELLPSDGGDFGFDNIASVLTTSPLLLERYLTAALRVADLAVGNIAAVPAAATYKLGLEVTQNQHMGGLPLGTRGGTVIRHNFLADGEYVLAGRLMGTVAEGYVGVEGQDEPHQFVITVDGEQVYSAPIGGPEDHEANAKDFLSSAAAIDERMTSPRVPITAGPHDVGFTWIERPAVEQNAWQPPLRATQEVHNPSGLPRLETTVIEGPYNVVGVSDTPSRQRIFVCKPQAPSEEAHCAEQIFAQLAKRALRRPVGDADLAAPLAFYANAREESGDFDTGIRAGIARLLVSPSFLFRAEADPVDLAAGSVHRISDVELASRMSFFLWSSIPDDELLDLAIAGRLRQPRELEAQVRRMIADSRADALVENFTGQWLQLRNLEQRVVPDLLMFPDFDDNARKAFRRETELLFASVLREQRSVLDLLRANYTFVDERLARHYGIPGVYGSRFRRVELTDPNRFGLLGHASILSLTSAATRTSPIIRGKYVMANFLNNPPPMPPAVVPALEDSKPTDRPSTVREQLELHRANPNCAVCHKTIDPVGFALENFDAVGQWQDKTVDGLPIDAAGTLADGTPVDGPVALREALLAKPEIFAGTVTEKLMIYALGRGLEPADMPVVRTILHNAAANEYRLTDIVLGIVDSLPFQMRSKPGKPSALATVAHTRE